MTSDVFEGGISIGLLTGHLIGWRLSLLRSDAGAEHWATISLIETAKLNKSRTTALPLPMC
ncbi:hypothetical protein DEU52_13310 [Ensifer adhaerens]|nr:hypothetical protein DEU52_13310 [Ensifer adhaerens]